MDFAASVEAHAKLRGLPSETPYWTCAYANEQHNLEGELTANPSETSFYKALMLPCCDGMLQIMNLASKDGKVKEAVVFERIW